MCHLCIHYYAAFPGSIERSNMAQSGSSFGDDEALLTTVTDIDATNHVVHEHQ